MQDEIEASGADRPNGIARATRTVLWCALSLGVLGTLFGLGQAERRRDELQDARRSADAAREKSQRLTRFMSETIAGIAATSLTPETTAREMLDQAAGRMQSVVEDPADEAGLHLVWASAYHRLGDVELAERHLGRALELLDTLPEPDPEQLHEILQRLALVRGEVDPRRAAEVLRRASAVRRRQIAARQPELALGLERLHGAVSESSVAVREALADTLRLARADFETGGLQSRLLGEELGAQAFVLSELGDEAESGLLLEAAITVLERDLPADHPELARLRLRLAASWLDTGDAPAAERVARQALASLERSLPPAHWRIEEARSLLGACRLDQGDDEEALALLRSAYAALRSTLGPAHRATLEAQCRWTRVVDPNAPPLEAGARRRELVEGYAFSPAVPRSARDIQTLCGPDHRALAAALSELRAIVRSAGGPDAQEPSWIEAGTESFERLQRLQRELPEGDPLDVVIARLLTEWSPGLHGTGAGQLRLALTEAALPRLQPHIEHLRVEVADAEQAQAEALLETGRPDLALEHAERAAMLYRAEFGDRSDSTLEARYTLGKCLRTGGRITDAGPVLTALLRDARAVYGDEADLTVRARRELDLSQAGATAARVDG